MGEPITAVDVAAAAVVGDRASAEILGTVGDLAGRVIATLINVHNPS